MFDRDIADDLPSSLWMVQHRSGQTLSHTPGGESPGQWGWISGLHDLRHSAATLMLAAGVLPGDVADRLGHAAAFTLTVYSHAIPGAQEAAAERLAALLNPSLGGSG